MMTNNKQTTEVKPKSKRRNGIAVRCCAALVGAGFVLAFTDMALDNPKRALILALGVIVSACLTSALIDDGEL